MSKELFWAGLIGITFGLIIAFGVWRVNSTLKPQEKSQASSPAPEKIANEFKITLDKPSENDVVTEDTITVSGITKPGVIINVSGESEDFITLSESNGVFSRDVALIPGINQIKVTAFDPEGNQSIEKVLVVYSSAFELKTSSGSPAPEASGDAEVRQKVQEKVQAALFKPKAYLGSVTDIADSTIQIKSKSGEIKQISTGTGEVSVVNSTGTTSKTVKLTDVAIGDYIVAMGYINGNSVLNAQRILITNAIIEPTANAFFGKVTETSAKTITVESFKNKETEDLTPTSKTSILSVEGAETTKTKIGSIETDNNVLYVTKTEDDKETLRTIFFFSQTQ